MPFSMYRLLAVVGGIAATAAAGVVTAAGITAAAGVVTAAGVCRRRPVLPAAAGIATAAGIAAATGASAVVVSAVVVSARLLPPEPLPPPLPEPPVDGLFAEEPESGFLEAVFFLPELVPEELLCGGAGVGFRSFRCSIRCLSEPHRPACSDRSLLLPPRCCS